MKLCDIALVLPPHQRDSLDYINPIIKQFRSAPYLPLGIISLTTYLKNEIPGCRVKIIDGQLMNVQQILKELKFCQPKIVGLSPLFHTYQDSLKIARFSKSFGARVVMGGNYAAGLAREIIDNHSPVSKDYCVDIVIRQDGEKGLVSLLKGRPFKEIAGAVFWRKSAFVENPIKLANLNDLPRPDFDLVDLSRYWSQTEKMLFPRLLPVQSRRGCDWRAAGRRCLFCSLAAEKLRIRKPEIFARDLIHYQRKYQMESIWDVSDDFLDNQFWLEECLRQFNGRRMPRFIIYARTDRINRKILPILQRFRIEVIIFGFESASASMLKKMDKPCRRRDNERAMEILKGSGIKAVNCVVIGGLGESSQTLRETVKAAKIIKRKNFNVLFSPFFLRPWPNSPARKMLIRKTALKYKGKDIFDQEEMFRDWLKHFSSINYKLAQSAYSELLNI